MFAETSKSCVSVMDELGWEGSFFTFPWNQPCVKETEFWGDALTMQEKNKNHCNISLLCICDIAPSFMSPYFKLQIFGTDYG
jgi:hypothetical protein